MLVKSTGRKMTFLYSAYFRVSLSLDLCRGPFGLASCLTIICRAAVISCWLRHVINEEANYLFLLWISLPVTNDKLRNSDEGQNSFRLDVSLSRLSLMTGTQKQRRKKSPFRLFVLCPSRCRLPSKPCCLLQEIFQFDLPAARFVTDWLAMHAVCGRCDRGKVEKAKAEA